MNKHNNSIKQYMLTIIVSAFVVVIFCFCIELELLFRSEDKIVKGEIKVANLSKFYAIDQLEKELLKNPKNYFATIRLAQMYEQLNELKRADEFYNSALKISLRSNYSLYSYAMFLARNNLFALSSTLAEELSGDDTKIVNYKAYIYEQIGDSLLNNSQYEASTKAYQVAFKYAKTLKNRKYLDNIRKKYSSSYIKLADENIKNENVSDAINNLKNSIDIKDNDTAHYKLGLIYLNFNKPEAEKEISQVFKSNPYMVNPYIYNSLLNSLLDETKIYGKEGMLNYYNMRLNSLKRNLLRINLYKNDVTISNSSIEEKKNPLFRTLRYSLKFKLNNNTKQKIENLYMQFEIYINSKKYVIDKKIVSPLNAIEFYESLDDIEIELPKDIELISLKGKNDVIIKYFARKMPKSPWVLIKIDSFDI